MSLSYHGEHLAWQQRVQQELTQANSFYKTLGQAPGSELNSLKPFPKVTQDDTNYKSAQFNLAYAFGGTRSIRAACNERPHAPRCGKRAAVRRHATPQHGSATREYVKALRKQLEAERGQRQHLEDRLKTLSVPHS